MKRRSIKLYHKIWHSFLLSILGILIILFIANVTIVSEFKNDIVYDQLEDAASYKINRRQDREYDDEDSLDLVVAHFAIQVDGNKTSLQVDSFTQTLFKTSEGQEIFDVLTSDAIKSLNRGDRHRLKIEDQNYYYLIKETDKNHYLVFFTSINRDYTEQILMVVVLLIFILISFFISKGVAKSIAKPIKDIDDFSVEVAKRNWTAIPPSSNIEEINDLSLSLDKMRQALKVAEERDREFLQASSHDLKTPVMIIKGYAQALIDGVNIENKESTAQVILTESERLERRILQLLRLNTFGHALEHQDSWEAIRVDRLIKRLVDKFKVLKPDLDWHVSLLPIEITGDVDSIRVGFENIIENQIRYAKSYVTVTMTETQNLIIEIANDGPHFTVDDPQTLFDAYKKDAGGKFGLGLAIVAQIISAHKGSVSASNEDVGVKFDIQLPTT